jgi:hypothetical protein
VLGGGRFDRGEFRVTRRAKERKGVYEVVNVGKMRADDDERAGTDRFQYGRN